MRHLLNLAKSGFKEDDSYRKLRTILTGADLVKFAKYNPEPSENELHFEYAWNFVIATMIKEEIAAATIIPDNEKKEGE